MAEINDDYKLYLEEKFKGLQITLSSEFGIVNERLKNIETQTTKTNGRVTKLEDYREQAQHIIDTRETNCPILPEIDKTNEKIDKMNEKFEDLSFFLRHPKLFIAGMAVIVIITLATFLNDNPLKVFQEKPPTEQTTTK